MFYPGCYTVKRLLLLTLSFTLALMVRRLLMIKLMPNLMITLNLVNPRLKLGLPQKSLYYSTPEIPCIQKNLTIL